MAGKFPAPWGDSLVLVFGCPIATKPVNSSRAGDSKRCRKSVITRRQLRAYEAVLGAMLQVPCSMTDGSILPKI